MSTEPTLDDVARELVEMMAAVRGRIQSIRADGGQDSPEADETVAEAAELLARATRTLADAGIEVPA